jgi:MFS family permease
VRVCRHVSRAVWRQRDFGLLWGGQTVSEIGSAVTTLALPTLAIFAFHAGPAAVGLMVASERVPFPIVALFAGAIVDRVRRRPVMVACNLARLVILAAIPILSTTGALRLWQLFVAAAAMGVFTVFFDIAYMAYVPGLVEPEQLLEANSRLQVTWSSAQLVGPGLGGLLVPRAPSSSTRCHSWSRRSLCCRSAGANRCRPPQGDEICSRRWARDSATCSASPCCAPSFSA